MCEYVNVLQSLFTQQAPWSFFSSTAALHLTDRLCIFKCFLIVSSFCISVLTEAAAAAAPPEPEEPLDISTYKNYQHHSYHPFTFADMDVEMAKYRLPQPTASRH